MMGTNFDILREGVDNGRAGRYNMKSKLKTIFKYERDL